MFDSILDDRNAAPSTEQAFCSTAHTIFRNDTKDKKLSIERETFQNLIGVGIIKDIKRLLFDENLLVVQQVVGQLDLRIIWHSTNSLREALGDDLSAVRAANAVGWKNLKFRVVWCVAVTAGNEERAIPAGNIDQSLDVGNEPFRAGDVKLAARVQEVHLHIYFPENKVGIWLHDVIPRYARKGSLVKIPHFVAGHDLLARGDRS